MNAIVVGRALHQTVQAPAFRPRGNHERTRIRELVPGDSREVQTGVCPLTPPHSTVVEATPGRCHFDPWLKKIKMREKGHPDAPFTSLVGEGPSSPTSSYEEGAQIAASIAALTRHSLHSATNAEKLLSFSKP